MFLIDGSIAWKPFSWYCSQSADLGRIKFPYAQQPDLQRVDGAEIPPEIVADWLREQKSITTSSAEHWIVTDTLCSKNR